jgi:hypothetical protein
MVDICEYRYIPVNMEPIVPRAEFWCGTWYGRSESVRLYTARIQRLACCALARRCRDTFVKRTKSTECDHVFRVVEEYADGKATVHQLSAASRLFRSYRRERCFAIQELTAGSINIANIAFYVRNYLGEHTTERIEAEEASHDRMLWLIQPRVGWADAWRTSDVVGLTSAMYADRRFDLAPMLADALEEAGCSDDLYLAILRSDVTLFRGCWLLEWSADRAVFNRRLSNGLQIDIVI